MSLLCARDAGLFLPFLFIAAACVLAKFSLRLANAGVYLYESAELKMSSVCDAREWKLHGMLIGVKSQGGREREAETDRGRGRGG